MRSRVPAAGLAAVLAVFAFFAVPADGYRYWSSEVWIPSAEEATMRWRASDFPLRFRMLENDNLPTDFEIGQERWTEIVRRSLDHWIGVRTANLGLVLEEATAPLSRADADDGINTIGFSSDERFDDSWITAFAAWRFDGDRLTGCDIEVNPEFVKNWAPQDPERLIEIVATHEMGHCLGLLHSEPFPMPLWTERPVTRDPAFLPDPVMSYSNSYGLPLPEDDRVGVSLLYPAPGFLEARGTVRGTVRHGHRGAPFSYVQAVRPGGAGARAGPGPGVFTDRNGRFSLEGLAPGDWMLWVHPILVTRRNAHGSLLEQADEAGATDFLDRLRWIRVAAGSTAEILITVEGSRGVRQ